MEKEIKVGMVLYKEMTYRNQPREIKEYTVSRIGNKYFYVAEDDRYFFDKKTLKYVDKNYTQNNCTLFLNKQEILDMWEATQLYDEIRKHFSSYSPRLSLQQLKEIQKIIAT